MRSVTIISLLATICLAGCGGKDDSRLHLELSRNKQGIEMLVLTAENLPPLEGEDDRYDIFRCWIDQRPPTISYEFERMMEWKGGARGGKGKVSYADGLTEIYGIKGNTYYGRGRVCAIAVSGDLTLISNVVTLPNKPDASDGK